MQAERKTLSKKRATDVHPYDQYHKALKAFTTNQSQANSQMASKVEEQSAAASKSHASVLKQRPVKRLKSASPKKHRKMKSSAGLKNKLRASENPELSGDPPIVNIDVDN